ncbi:Dihydrolipoyllysine-residue acetyltransferase component of pyruvate dehydrogenase complex [Pigmentiphaga humi]|uniref:Acetyltransferase component of pyruvate dehydrogenase complex n=1 Tax=Pigmentiphaga humi TaxID=2478468 RepID=A0A3P4B1R0_9BURK|nr:dihydrolipoyllysine-residue acetyltransferase [Pigmentiphaga humi]VCU69588.1 Dihydrolipoyllysine-residue acetyltransferase component of pyruvate dehydrogenase complex [Pigmentiphaga humi]
MSNVSELKVPDIGDFSAVEVIEILVSVGDAIKAEQSLVTVESDKSSMEIPASEGGVVKAIKVKVGDKVSEGSVLVEIEGAAAEAEAPRQEAAPSKAEAPAAPAKQEAAPAAAPQAAPAQGGGEETIDVPDIGDFKDVEVIEVLVKVGDKVSAEQSLITVESDKSSMEIPSSAAGEVVELLVKVGDKVSKGSQLVKVKTGASAAAAPAKAESAPAAKPAEAAPAAAAPAAAPAATRQPPVQAEASSVQTGAKSHASPSVRKFARELGVDLAKVTASGPKGRITPDDVRNFVKQALAGGASTAAAAPAAGASGGGLDLLPWPKVDFTKFGEIESKPLSRIKKISGANLHRNWVMIPHVTNNEDADITSLEAFRVQLNKENEKSGIKLTMLAFLIKAVVSALKKFPEFNASLDGDNLVLKKYFHIGFAADTPNGLVVPVIRDADKKGVLDIAKESSELAKKARDGKLSPAEMQGGCFSISSLGGIGGTTFTPIINAPEVAILGVSRSFMKPVWDGKQFVPQLTLPMSLSYDHRVIDGAAAARFNAHLAAVLADFRRIML